MGYRLVYRVNPGVEDIAALEITAELGGNTWFKPMSGRVFHETSTLRYEAIYRLRSINRASINIWSGEIGPSMNDLVMLRDRLSKDLEGVSRYISPLNSFAVVTERSGSHEFTSMDVSRVIGDIIIEKVKAETGMRPPVNLRTPSVIVDVIVAGEEMAIGVSLTGHRSMHRRGYRVYDHPAALKPTLAYSMLWLSGTRDGQSIIDPMCGGGTIPIEAALHHEEASIYCYDKDPHHIRGARNNALAAGVSSRIRFGVWDARRINELGQRFDHVVLNPPYGIRYGDPKTVRRLYTAFMHAAYEALNPGGRLTMITTEYNHVQRTAEALGFGIVEARTVQHGGLYPKIIVMEK